jgi:Methyltransferase domain
MGGLVSVSSSGLAILPMVRMTAFLLFVLIAAYTTFGRLKNFYYYPDMLQEMPTANRRASSSIPWNTEIDIMESNPLVIPRGQAKALPSIRVQEAQDTINRGQYGGQGDQIHLGGFTAYDGQGVSPAVFQNMIGNLGVKSVMDVGCGKGISSLYFVLQGVDTLCIEGSHDAVAHSLLPDPETQVVEHDFSRGPYWPAKTYDAVWSVEFLEHVGRNYQYNYIQAFRKAALIFVSSSRWGGWHHVEVHTREWWITRFQFFGFHFNQDLTDQIQKAASEERDYASGHPDNVTASIGPDGQPYNAQHVWLNMMVFVNPVVASLPRHAHLLAEHGCYESGLGKDMVHRECDGIKESKLPESFYPLKHSTVQHNAWLKLVNASIATTSQ